MEWPIFASKQVRIVTDFLSLSFANFSRQATNLFRCLSVTFRSDCETSSKWIQHLFNFKCLNDQLVSAAILLLSTRDSYVAMETCAISRSRKRNIDDHWSILSKFQVYFLPIVHTSERGLCISWKRRLICIVLWRNFLASRHVQRTWKIEQTCDFPAGRGLYLCWELEGEETSA
jgi:hypothetical protein